MFPRARPSARLDILKRSVRGYLQLGPDGTTDSGAFQSAISVGILRQILLVVILGVVKGRSIQNLRRDGAPSRRGERRLIFRPGCFGLGLLLGARCVND